MSATITGFVLPAEPRFTDEQVQHVADAIGRVDTRPACRDDEPDLLRDLAEAALEAVLTLPGVLS